MPSARGTTKSYGLFVRALFQISAFPMGYSQSREQRDVVGLLHENKLTICVTSIAFKQALVACKYNGSFATGCP